MGSTGVCRTGRDVRESRSDTFRPSIADRFRQSDGRLVGFGKENSRETGTDSRERNCEPVKLADSTRRITGEQSHHLTINMDCASSTRAERQRLVRYPFTLHERLQEPLSKQFPVVNGSQFSVQSRISPKQFPAKAPSQNSLCKFIHRIYTVRKIHSNSPFHIGRCSKTPHLMRARLIPFLFLTENVWEKFGPILKPHSENYR